MSTNYGEKLALNDVDKLARRVESLRGAAAQTGAGAPLKRMGEP